MNIHKMSQKNNSSSIKDHSAISNLVLGAGLTGLSCLRYLNHKGELVKLYDDQLNVDKLAKVKAISENISIYDQNSNLNTVLEGVDTLLLSPGVSHQHPLVSQAKEKHINLVGDIEIFARQNKRPVIAVTGSNGKSTVVTLLELMAKEQGVNVSLAGNIGRPLLDSILEEEAELYVLELSSFQLDITETLEASVACILNVSPDHLDRYDSYADYANAKQKVYQGAKSIVYNRDDALSEAKPIAHGSENGTVCSFGMNPAEDGHFGISLSGSEQFLCYGSQKIIAVKECKKNGSFDIQNALAAMAIASAAGFSFQAISSVLKEFSGLAHRCEWVLQHDDVNWINDSKGTNVGATEAALDSIVIHTNNNVKTDSDASPSVILIAGGDSKGGDLSLLVDSIQSKVKALLLIGQDAALFQENFESFTSCKIFASLREAVEYAASISQKGDTVLLSPACASTDMFKNYQDRGDQFKALVKSTVHGGGL